MMSLEERVIRQGELAYDPELPAQIRAADEASFKELLASTKTMALMPVLTSLVQPEKVKPWLRPHFIQALTLLPLRPKGVRSTIEFVLSVHPSTVQNTNTSQTAAPESRGPSISLEALNSASRLISSPPSSMSAETWFSGIGPQLLSLLDGEGGLEMIKSASFVIGYGILGRRQLGAPGTAGWNAFAEPLLGRIDPNLYGIHSTAKKQSAATEGEIISVKPTRIIVTDIELSEALRRLASLLSSHPNPGLSKRLLEPLLLPLWSLSSWPVDSSEDLEEWRAPASYLLQIMLQISSNATSLITIVDHILFQGNRDASQIRWIYKLASTGGIQIETMANDTHSIERLNSKVKAFIELIRPMKDADEVPVLFLLLCKRWLSIENPSSKVPEVLHSLGIESEALKEAQTLIDIKILTKMIDELPERLVGDSNQVLELARDVLQKVAQSDANPDRDDTATVALSLVNLLFTSEAFKKSIQNREAYDSVKVSLGKIAKYKGSENAITAQNLLFLVDFQTSEFTETDNLIPDKVLEDRRTYNLAISYLTSTESPPPVRAQGIELISGLIGTNSPVLDIPATLVLLSSLIQDEEEYIYLRVVKAFVLLSIKHPRVVARDLIDRYIDPNEERSLDTRLRVGESLLQVVEQSRSSFSGDLAHEISSGLLFVAGRRGYRPKTEAYQKKKATANRFSQQEAEDAWDGEVPQLEDITTEDELLNQIIEGWESKRGQEDVRIRASALSIFGVAIETNIAGMSSSVISSAVDMSVNILALEPEPEKAILRRAAILLIMSLIKALDKAREEGVKLRFGFSGQSLEDVMRILRYVQETDNDGLVRQHAKDVVEGLDTWQVKSLLPVGDNVHMKLGELAGLSVNPLRDQGGKSRPRIEEIE